MKIEVTFKLLRGFISRRKGGNTTLGVYDEINKISPGRIVYYFL